MEYKKRHRNEWMKRIISCFGMLVLFSALVNWYQIQAAQIYDDMLIIGKKSDLISRLHKDMNAFTEMQFKLMLSDAPHEKKLLKEMIYLVNDYLVSLSKFEQIANKDDVDLLNQFKSEFNRWHQMNNDVLTYLYNVSDPAARNALASISLALERLNPESPIMLAALYRSNVDSEKLLNNLE